MVKQPMFKSLFFGFSQSLLALLVLIASLSMNVAECQNVSLKNQFDVDNFDPSQTTIDGNLFIGDSGSPYKITDLSNLSNIERINGKLTINYTDSLINIDALSSLVYVKEEIHIFSNKLLENINGLSNLTSGNGTIEIRENALLLNVDGLVNLNTIKDGMFVEDNPSLLDIDGLINLRTINTGLTIRNNPMLANMDGITNLEYINGDLILSGNRNITNIDFLLGVDSVFGDFSIDSMPKIENLSALSGLEYVKDRLTLSGFDLVKNIDALSGLSYINEIRLWGNQQLANIDGLSNTRVIRCLWLTNLPALRHLRGVSHLEKIGGFVIEDANLIENLDELTNFQEVGSLSFSNNANLVNIDGLKNIKAIVGGCAWGMSFRDNPKLESICSFPHMTELWGGVVIDRNSSLKKISGFNNVESIVSIYITNNKSLVSISGFEKLKEIRFDLRIYNNESLMQCCGINKMLVDVDPNPISGAVTIFDNSPGCNHRNEVLMGGECDMYISGLIFYDANENKIWDLGEVRLEGVEVKCDLDLVISDELGKYNAFVNVGEQYNCSVILDEGWWLTTDSMTYSGQRLEGSPFDTKNHFGLILRDEDPSTEISLVALSNRCNESNLYYSRFLNTGAYSHSGRIEIELDNRVSYISSNLPMTVVGQKIYYDFVDLEPFKSIDLQIELSGASESETGELLVFVSEVFYIDNSNEELQVGNHIYETEVLCSYDPNDKQVSPPGVKDENYTLSDEVLEYTIRFQNTGNAPAINISILDTLDANLDMETFKVLNSSFLQTTSVEGSAIAFHFEDINLVDSLTNEKESHGFVTYSIKPHKHLILPVTIKNTAYILFDFNPAIVTNTTKNTLVTKIPSCPVSVNEIKYKNNVFIYPNPSKGIFKVDLGWDNDVKAYEILDLNGKVVLKNEFLDPKETINVSTLDAGAYIFKVLTSSSFYAKKIILY